MAQYRPSGMSTDEELWSVSRALQNPNEVLMLSMSYKPPEKPRDGMILLADGTEWNPTGEGVGFYGYYSGGWRKLG